MTDFNLRNVKIRSGEQLTDEIAVEIAPLEFGGQRYVSVPEKVDSELEISRASTGTVFQLRFHSRLHGPCQRCLADAVIDQEISGREYQAANPEASEELRTPYVDGDRLDLSAWARDSIVLELPQQILCRPDCAGLCPVCGKDLNVEPHEHEQEIVDSRWAALAELRDHL